MIATSWNVPSTPVPGMIDDGVESVGGLHLKPIQGGCLCGAVRYQATAEPIMTRTCWCRVCQYFAAGNASVNVVFAKDAVMIDVALPLRRTIGADAIRAANPYQRLRDLQ